MGSRTKERADIRRAGVCCCGDQGAGVRYDLEGEGGVSSREHGLYRIFFYFYLYFHL